MKFYKNNRFKYIYIKRILRDYTQSPELNKIDWFWLSGFIQGDGSFIARFTKKEFVLYVSQHINDIQLLYKIKSFVGFGYVKRQEKENMAHYVLQKRNGLIFVLNNLCPSIGQKTTNFNLFLKEYAITYLKLNDYSFISFENAWLSGFIDADGSFYGSYTKNKKMISGYQLQLKFAIMQKDLVVLKFIVKLFNIKVRYNKKGFYYFILSDTTSLDLLVNYLMKYPLLSKKAISLKKWLLLYNIYKSKKHLEMSPEYLEAAVKSINNFLGEDIVRSSMRME